MEKNNFHTQIKEALLNQVWYLESARRRGNLKSQLSINFESQLKSIYDSNPGQIDDYLLRLAENQAQLVTLNDDEVAPGKFKAKVPPSTLAALRPRMDQSLNEILETVDTTQFNPVNPPVIALQLPDSYWVRITSPLFDLKGMTDKWVSLWKGVHRIGFRDMVATGLTANYCSWELKRIQMLKNVTTGIKMSDVVDGLIRGKSMEASQLIAAKTRGVDLSLPHCVMAIEPNPNQHVLTAMSKFGIPAIWQRVGNIYAIINSLTDVDHAGSIAEQYRDLLKRYGEETSIGVGLPTNSMSDYRRSWYEAVSALVRGKTLHGNGGKIFQFDDLGLDQGLFYLGSDMVREQIPEYLKRLLEEDADTINHGSFTPLTNSQKFESLHILSASGWNKTRASEPLGLHVNTVKQRAELIEHELDISLDDVETRQTIDAGLRMALALPDIERAERLSETRPTVSMVNF